jgi:2-keto-4-pentenoate hydratase
MSTDGALLTASAGERALDRLVEARRTGSPCAPVRDLLGLDGLTEAYAVQTAWVRSREQDGVRVIGRKIGLTNPAVQAQLGVDSPDYGFLLADMEAVDGGEADPAGLLQPRIEAEIAFVLGADLDLPDPTAEDVRAATDHVRPALEIVDSRIAGWDIRLVDTVADNASAAGFVLGEQRTPLDGDLTAVLMTMDRNGERVSEGSGADCLGSPLLAVAWLARVSAGLGRPLRAGEIVLSGALGRVVDVRPGDAFSAELSGLGSVSVSFGGVR